MNRCALELGGTAAVPRKRAAAVAVDGGSCRARDDAIGLDRLVRAAVAAVRGFGCWEGDEGWWWR